MRKRWQWGLLGLMACYPLTAHGDEIRPEAIERVKKEMQAAIEDGKLAGGSHLVQLNGKTICLESLGVCDIEDDRPFQADTVVRIYSMSKPITSVAAMMLYDQGKFQLDDPVGKYIPAFAKTSVLAGNGEEAKVVPAKRPITVRDVLRHTTGYSYGGGNAKAGKYYQRERLKYRPPAGMLPPKMSIAQAAEALARIPANHHPGERFTYGFSTDLLGRLVEVWSGQPLDRYLQKAVFTPLEMRDTGFQVTEKQRNRFASCHTLLDGKLGIIDKAQTSAYNQGFEFLSGGGGLVSSIKDYANFCQMLVDGGAFHGKRILKASTVEEMFTDQLDGAAGTFRFGLGFAINEVELGSGERARKVQQYSWGGYASTDFHVVPDVKLVQIFFRQRVPSEHGLARRVFPVIYAGFVN